MGIGAFILVAAASLGIQTFGNNTFGASVFSTFQGGTGTSSPSGILYGSGSATALQTVKIGTNLTFSGGTLSAAGSSGGVATTSFAATYPIQVSTSPLINYSSAFGTTTTNTWSNLQTFTSGFISNASSTIASGLFNMSGGASTTLLTVSGNQWLTALATPAGTVLAVDPTGKIIATSTSAGGVTAVTGTYPVQSSGGSTPAISLAFGTTTANTWSALQTFSGGFLSTSSSTVNALLSMTNASTTLLTIGSTWSTANVNTLLNTDTNGKFRNTIVSYPLVYTGSTGTLSNDFSTTTVNTWSQLQTFTSGFLSNASSTVTGKLSSTNSSSTLLSATTAWFTNLFTTNASTSLFTVSGNTWLTNLATAAGTFLAVDPNGKVIATTTPSGGSGSSAFTYITSQSATATTPYLYYTGLTSTYQTYKFVLTNVVPQTTNQSFYIRISTDGGATYKGTTYLNSNAETSGVSFNNFDGTQNDFRNTGGQGVSAEISVGSPADASRTKMFHGTGVGNVGGNPSGFSVNGWYDGNNNAVNGVQFIFSSGNVASGTIDVYGLKESN